jgi:5-methylcytosine-specific restriction protein A
MRCDMAKNETYKKLIHTNRWLKLRKQVLSAHPVCQMCEAEGLLRAATEVHHIVPCETAVSAVEMRALMFDPHNVMAVCHRHHVELHTAMGKGGKDERRKRADRRLSDFCKKFLTDDPGADFFKGGDGR